ncbi:inositol phospholipid synthesis and fat-storage-inducing TM-domain-containing protein [Hypoxylon rubiginosum]|uniref:Inositol phospholipid synthesis and fat-storage-inducing TM-domain-containing protein n=1 Tax=Hypoxylon rubiginosum TaxID=110542 RepID=A0ACC0DET4_9PEZI|nr:inositol phospholipid synthesis and fat-storage-inducing TM-domain-containing protein [Hypoxylon rubiginosum]
MTDNDNTTNSSLRPRQTKMVGNNKTTNGSPPRSTTSSSSSSAASPLAMRTSPFLPTPLETLALAAYPALLAFGTLFSVLSPQTRGAPYDAGAQSHNPATAPSYFARKDNVFNVLFVKRGWAWISISFLAFVLTHPALNNQISGNIRKVRAATRWVLVTAWWALVTQWCFGPPLIDRGFRFTGGRCEVAAEAIEEGIADKADAFTAAACRASGGRWSGGHDVSGHVFLLVLGSYFLVQEVGWVACRAGRLFGPAREERCVVMGDGAVKGAGVEADKSGAATDESELGVGGKFALVVVALCWWMLLMTAIYFHTWFEKFTGLLVAAMAIYPVYILPRWVPALRAFIGMPGI